MSRCCARRSTAPISRRGAGHRPEGTRRNMLGEALLDAEHNPQTCCGRAAGVCRAPAPAAAVRSAATPVAKPGAGACADHGARAAAHISVPVRYQVAAGALVVSGEAALKQSELGLTPFSALLVHCRCRTRCASGSASWRARPGTEARRAEARAPRLLAAELLQQLGRLVHLAQGLEHDAGSTAPRGSTRVEPEAAGDRVDVAVEHQSTSRPAVSISGCRSCRPRCRCWWRDRSGLSIERALHLEPAVGILNGSWPVARSNRRARCVKGSTSCPSSLQPAPCRSSGAG